MLFFIVLLITFILPAAALHAQQEQPAATEVIGYIDEDKDGRNELFRDSDGDGINDIGLRPYRHHFTFVDEDKDGRNDLFRDSDGDGVNDLDGRYFDRDRDGYIDNIVDFDGDNINDITGEQYGPRGLKGYRFGHIFEERRRPVKRFFDEDGDGMHDLFKRLHQRMLMHDRRMDFFFDEDGDGIDDARLLHRKMKALGRMMKHRSKMEPPRKVLPSNLRRDEQRGNDHKKGGQK